MQNQSEPDQSREDLDAFTLHELKRGRSDSDLIIEICRRAGWDWDEAIQYLETARTENQSTLTAHTGRIGLLASLAFLVAGVLDLVLLVGWLLYNPRTGSFMNPVIRDQAISVILNSLFALASQSPLAGVIFFLASTGLLMIVGGLIGLIQAFWQIMRLHQIG